MAIQIKARGIPQGEARHIIGRVTHAPVSALVRADYVRIISRALKPDDTLEGYAAVLFEGNSSVPVTGVAIDGYQSLEFLHDGYIVGIQTHSGHTRALYRPDSDFNTIFTTDRCNSNCLMCSQPPKDVDDGHVTAEHLRLISLIESPPKQLGITGGEPTLLKDGLIQIVSELKKRFPDTFLIMLSNGRTYAHEDFVQKLAAIGHPHFLTSIPLYADNAADHDYIVQAKGAFDQTIHGFYNAAKNGLAVEVRVVLHKQTVPRLIALMEFIYRNLPFVRHVALMGLENMGYVKKNWDLLWIDPVDYVDTLEAAVRHLYHRHVEVSIYNLPLCILPRSLWSFARQSISDFKNIYLEECSDCLVRNRCSGLFQSSETRHSRGIRALMEPLLEPANR